MLFLLLAAALLTLSAQAETGGTQAVMTLIVLPNDANLSMPASGLGKNTQYNGDTMISSLQKRGAHTCKVWVSI
jgi:hypothetical protein